MDLASPAVSGTSVYANGLRRTAQILIRVNKIKKVQCRWMALLISIWRGNNCKRTKLYEP